MTRHLLTLCYALSLLAPALSRAQDPATDAAAAERIPFEVLVVKMCSILNENQLEDYGQMPYKIETEILNYNGWSRDLPDYRKRVSAFWNERNQDFICSENHVYVEQHLFKRAVQMKLYSVVLHDYFLNSNDEGTENLYDLDLNAYEVNSRGDKETLLDFLDDIKNTPKKAAFYNMPEINQLRRIIVKFFGAKHGSELPDDTVPAPAKP